MRIQTGAWGAIDVFIIDLFDVSIEHIASGHGIHDRTALTLSSA